MVDVAAGFAHNLVLMSDRRTLYGFGHNGHGALLGDNNVLETPVVLPITDHILPTEIINKVAAGKYLSFAIVSSRRVFCWGRLSLLFNTTMPRVFINSAYDLLDIAASNNHALFLNVLGEVFAIGMNEEMQLGLIGKSRTTSFEKLNIFEIAGIATGSKGSLFISDDRYLFSTGRWLPSGDGSLAKTDTTLKSHRGDMKDWFGKTQTNISILSSHVTSGGFYIFTVSFFVTNR